jgi:hypothetical protein
MIQSLSVGSHGQLEPLIPRLGRQSYYLATLLKGLTVPAAAKQKLSEQDTVVSAQPHSHETLVVVEVVPVYVQHDRLTAAHNIVAGHLNHSSVQ